NVRLFEVSAESQYELQKNSFKQEFLYRRRSHLIEAGFGADFLTTVLRWNITLDSTLQAIIDDRGGSILTKLDETARYNRYHAYVQDRIQFGRRLYIEPGLRYDYYDVLAKTYLSPRIHASYALDEITTLRAGLGRYYQSPGYEKLVDQQRRGFVQLTDEALGRLEAEQATHVVAGFDRWITEGIQVRTDAYFKRFQNLIGPRVVTGTRYETVQIPGSDPRDPAGWSAPASAVADSTTTIPDNNSYGSAYGFEILVEKRRTSASSRLYGWASYALAWANRNERGRAIPFDFDQRHSVNLVLNYRLWEWFDIGVTWRYGSNFPYTPALGVKPRIVTSDDGTPEIQTDVSGSVIFDVDRGDFENVNTARKPAYHRLDVRFTAYTTLFGLDASFYLDVINAYNRSNVLTYNYYITDSVTLGSRPTTMFPILPTLGMSLRF
ncbi:MAG: TonB-dependent receptor, partial [Proteobacteria bacterium]|nr:TonB-dependent receptor [Pseudomonadota bacterium]